MTLDFTIGDILSSLVLVLMVASFFYNKNRIRHETDLKISNSQAKQEEKNETFKTDIQETKKELEEHNKADIEHKNTTNKELTKIYRITTKLETQNEAIMKKLNI